MVLNKVLLGTEHSASIDVQQEVMIDVFYYHRKSQELPHSWPVFTTFSLTLLIHMVMGLKYRGRATQTSNNTGGDTAGGNGVTFTLVDFPDKKCVCLHPMLRPGISTCLSPKDTMLYLPG